MKKLFLVLMVMVVIPFAGKAQTEKTAKTQETAFFLGLNSGLDFDINAYKLDKNEIYGYTYYNQHPRYNIGFDMGLKVSKKLRTRIEMKFVNIKYGINYGPNIENTIVNLNYFDFNFHLDYLWLTKGKFQLFISPAVKYEYKIGEAIGGPNYSNIMDLRHPSSIGGAALSAIGKYNLSKHFGITFTPEYTFFFHGFATGNSKPYQRISTNLGVEFTF